MQILTLEQAKQRGKILAGAWIWDYPHDKWIPIAENWDINLWTEYDINDVAVKQLASIYPVEDDCTNYSTFYRVWEHDLTKK